MKRASNPKRYLRTAARILTDAEFDAGGRLPLDAFTVRQMYEQDGDLQRIVSDLIDSGMDALRIPRTAARLWLAEFEAEGVAL